MEEFRGEKLNKFFWKYEEALKFLELQIGSFVRSIEASDEHNPIEHYKGRIKSLDSIRGKLERRRIDFNEENIVNNLNDVAGIRIVCHFKKDLKKMIELMRNNPYIEVIEEKDYVTVPKSNGYSSYHMIVKVPVVDNGNTIYVPAEIQIRTLAMDYSASLEHKVRYKKSSVFTTHTNQVIDHFSVLMRSIDDRFMHIIDDSEKHKEKIVTDTSLLFDIEMSNRINDNFLKKYDLAMTKVEYIIGGIVDDLKASGNDSIEDIKFRRKAPKSIAKKLLAKDIDVTEENIDNELSDVVGGRIICSFFSDMEDIIKKVLDCPEFEIVNIKDYVTNPKDSGYSSYHIIARVPIFYRGREEKINVEIQVRTKAMNMWASLHHKLCYKTKTTDSIERKLKEWASILRMIDKEYDEIYREARENNSIGSRSAKIRLRHLDNNTINS